MSWTEADLREYVAAIEELQRIEQKLVDGGLLFAYEMITCNPQFGVWAIGRIQRLRTLYEPLNYEKLTNVFYSDGTLRMIRDDMGPAPIGWYFHIGRRASGGPYKTKEEAREQYDKTVEFSKRYGL